MIDNFLLFIKHCLSFFDKPKEARLELQDYLYSKDPNAIWVVRKLDNIITCPIDDGGFQVACNHSSWVVHPPDELLSDNLRDLIDELCEQSKM